MHCRKTGCMFYKMTKDGKRIAPVQNKPKKASVVEVKKGGAAKQKLTIWSVNQYSIRILANSRNTDSTCESS